MHLWIGVILVVLGDSVPQPAPTSVAAVSRVEIPSPLALARDADEKPEVFYRRLAVHRAASYALLPLFAFQYAAGSQLFDNGADAPQWAQVGHRVGATGVAALFATNLITGIPNLMTLRHEPRDRRRRVFHATAMLVASAGFTATGVLAERAEGDPDMRSLHRTVALSSMGVATIGYLSMLDLFRGR
jgi:hypothetical protein